MAKNDKHGSKSNESDFDFDDDYNFDEYDDFGEPDRDDRSPRSLLKRFGRALKDDALSPAARRKYFQDSLPTNYHTTLNSVNSITDAGADLYNDVVLREWEKTQGPLKRAIRADGDKLRRIKLGRLVDWAEKKDESYQSNYNAEEAEIQRQMGGFSGSLKDAMNGGNLSPSERRELMNAGALEKDYKEGKEQEDDSYRSTTVAQQSATVGLLSRILDAQNRRVDYQDQVDFVYKQKTIEFGIRNLIGQRKVLEQTSLMRAEIKDGLAAIAKNTGLPDYVKITSQENAKRLLRDKMVNQASDWAGNKIGGVLRTVMDQTKRNIASMGLNVRDKANTYADTKEMMDGVGVGMDEILMGMGASLLRSQASKRGGKYIRDWIAKNPKYTKGLDLTEAWIANSGAYANMAMNGRSGYQKLDNLLRAGGYDQLAQRQNTRIADSNANRQDEAAYMTRKLQTTFTDVYPAWFNRIWKSIEGIRTGKDTSQIEDQHYDFKYNRLRGKSDLQREFDNETFDENKLKNYNDGIDNWINRLDPKGTFSPEARDTIRRWLINNHAKNKESFPVSLYRGEDLPRGTPPKVRRELEDKIPALAGFDPLKVAMVMGEGLDLELKVLRQNPEYRKMSKLLGNADSQARSRNPIDNQRISRMTERYGQNFLVDSGIGQYDKEGNVSLDTDNIIKMTAGGGYRNYTQRNNMDDYGNITPIPGVDQDKRAKDDERTPIRHTGMGQDRKTYDRWTKSVLQNINGPRLRGFASGGFTNGDPDEVAGVTHGDETVIDSQGTKQNKTLLSGILKLGAPVIKNGQFNRAYYKYLGFKNPGEIDLLNTMRNISIKDAKAKAEELKDKASSRAKDRLKSIRDSFKNMKNEQFHSDGYLDSFGPTPDFMGPVRTGGLRNNAQSLKDTLSSPEEFMRQLRGMHLKDRVQSAKSAYDNFDRKEALGNVKDYANRARDAVKSANQSKNLDFEATRQLIGRDIQDGKVDTTKPISLFLAGTNSPFITKGDMRVGRFRNKTDGSIITKPADIMDDIVFVDERGDYETIATMADMLEGVYDSRGQPVKLVGLDEGYRKYVKRSTMAARAIRNSKIGRFVSGLKSMVWDDHPVDVCILVNSQLVTVLKASGFVSCQYLDAETLDVLKSHNDIQGAVVNPQGETLLTLEELAGGLYDQEGNQLTISRLKHIRNKIVTKIENTAKKAMKIIKDKVLGKAMDFMEGMSDRDIYVMRWMGRDRQLTRVIEYVDIEANLLINVSSGKRIEKPGDITGAVYSSKTKSVILKEDEFKLGLFDSKGNPYKDFKNMTLAERVKFQQDKFFDKLEKGISSATARIKNLLKRKEKTETVIEDGETPIDVYVMENGSPRLVLEKQGFIDQIYRDLNGNAIEKPSQISGTVMSSAGRILLTKNQIEKGLFTAEGNPIKTALSNGEPPERTTGSRVGNMVRKLRNRLKRDKPKMEDLYKPDNMDTPYITADKLNSGKIVQLLSRKPVEKYSDLAQGAADIDDPSFLLTKETAATLVLADGRNAIKTGGIVNRTVAAATRMFGSIGSKLNSMRKGSWQWLQAKREEAARNKGKDVTVNVNQGDGKEKKGWMAKLLSGLGLMFGGMFTKMMTRFGKLFKSVRNAVLFSKVAGAGGSILGGAGGAPAAGRAGLMKKLLGGALLAGGSYAAYKHLNGGEEDFEDEGEGGGEDTVPAEGQEDNGKMAGGLISTNPLDVLSNGGIGTDIAMNAGLLAAPWLAGKMFGNRTPDPAATRRETLRQRLAARAGRAGANAAGAAGRGLGAGARDVGRAGSMLGRLGGGIARRLPGVAGLVAKGGLALGAGLKWAMSPTAALGRLGSVAKIGSAALKVGKFALGAGRILAGPIGWGLTAAVWIGGKLWERYKNKKAPLLHFRIAQYGFDFNESDTTGKLLDLENLLQNFVTVNAQGQPSIKDNIPEDKIFELFEIDPNNPEDQEHTQRFIAWWVKRFKPVYLSYVKQTHRFLKKFDISQIDDELSKVDKLELIKGVHFTSPQNNPYMVSASPFTDPEECTETIEDVTDAYKRALKYIEQMPDDKKTEKIEDQVDENGKPKEKKKPNASWLDNTKEGISDMVDKTLSLTKTLGTKTADMFSNWMNRATSTVKDLWGKAMDWFNKATGGLGDKISAAWDKVKGIAGGIADGVSNAVGNVVGGVADAGNTALGWGSQIMNSAQGMMSSGTTLGGSGKWSSNKNDALFQDIRDASSKYGLDARMMTTMAYIESRGNPNAKNPSGASGIYQFMPSTAKAYGLSNPFNQGANVDAGARFTRDNIKYFTKTVGRPPQPHEVYLLHQQGIGGASAISKAADRGTDVPANIRRNMNANGGQGKTPKQFLDYWKAKYAEADNAVHGRSSAGAQPAAQVASPSGSSVNPNPIAAAAGMVGGTAGIGAKAPTPSKTSSTPNYDVMKQGVGMIGGGVVQPNPKSNPRSGTKMGGDANASNLPEPPSLSQNPGQARTQGNVGPMAGNKPSGNIPPWMTIAIQELNRGVGEAKDLARANQYFADLGYPSYNAKDQSWCAAFVSWCLKESGTPYNTKTPLGAAAGYTNWGKPLSKTDIPYGAIVVISPSHVFFAAGVENGKVRGLGGNQGKPGSVKYSNFPLSSVTAVRWPSDTVMASSGPNTANRNAQIDVQQQAQQQQQSSTQRSEGNARGLPEPSTRAPRQNPSYQAASQSVESANASYDANVAKQQLDETRTQTKLLTEIRDAVTGHRSDSSAMGDKTVGAINGMDASSRAQVELIAGGINAMMTTLKEFRKNNKPETLSDQFPIGALK